MNEKRPGRLLRRLEEEPYTFDFFRAVQILEAYFRDGPPPGEGSDVSSDVVRFRPDPSMVFPATDIRRFDVSETGGKTRCSLQVTFMGLYGIASPLPVYFYTHLASRADETDALRDFLDIFNHRLYAYFYRAWKKYHPSADLTGRRRQAHIRRFMCLAGLGTDGIFDRRSDAGARNHLAAYAGHLSGTTRSAAGLKALIADVFSETPVAILQNIPRKVPVTRRGRAGARGIGGLTLGRNSVIGRNIYDVSGKFRVSLGPMPLDRYLGFLPGAPDAVRLRQLVSTYVTDNLTCDVELKLDTGTVPPTTIGTGGGKLGLTAFAGKPQKMVVSRIVEYPPGLRKRSIQAPE